MYSNSNIFLTDNATQLINISGLYVEKSLGNPLVTFSPEIKFVLLFKLVSCSFYLYHIVWVLVKIKCAIIGWAVISKTML